MRVEEVTRKFSLNVEEVESGYYKVLTPKKISLLDFKDCFDRCILIYKDLEDVLDKHHCVIDKKGVLYYFTPFLDDEHSKISSIAKADGITKYYYKGYNHDFKEDNGIDSIFLKGEMP